MFRRYWRAILAAIALIIVLPPLGYTAYQLYDAAKQRNSGYHYQPADQSRGTIVGIPKSPAKAYQPNCNNPQSNSDADLCAQWAAVEQVTESNRLTSLGAQFAVFSLIATAIATGLLVWTLWESRDHSRREQRAYLRLEVHGEGTVLPAERIFVPIHIINYGTTPAICCAVETNVAVALPNWDWSQNTADQSIKDNRPAITIHPGPPTFVKLESAEVLPQDIYDGIMSGHLVVFAKCLVTYSDIFRRKRRTRLHLEFHGADAGHDGTGGKIRVAPHGNDFT